MEPVRHQAETANDSTGGFQEAQQQLAELQLLTRAEHQAPSGSSQLPSGTMLSPSVDDATDSEREGVRGALVPEQKVAATAKTSFTAILATSRNLVASQSSTSHPELTAGGDTDSDERAGAVVPPLGRVHALQREENQGELESVAGRSLPTLIEDGEGEGEEEEEEGEEGPKMALDSVYYLVTTNCDASLSYLDGMQQNMGPGQTADEGEGEGEGEEGDDGSGEGDFRDMLTRVSRREADSLRLGLGDLTVSKLERVCDALNRPHRTPDHTALSSVRTRVAVDMLRLLVQRLGAHAVQGAIGRASRGMLQWEDASSGLEPIIVVTESNIASMALMAHREVTDGATATPKDPPSYLTSLSPISSDSISGEHPISPVRRTPRSSTTPTRSPRSRTPSKLATDRRSILARDGAHVLMQEKLSAFDYRGQTAAPTPFRVGGDSAATTESAAKRRQCALQYASDHTTQRTVL